ncbi:NAD-dependent succinate-semialdehyde dehydrogenase [Entomomonas asaccharolytica]|uniref:NAD-dependent succinate-semialdehyde dehydrogenase n=1 Tax=Entomomonas asaccharolytica TaxID=2785331 RepID=A0A974NH03_9GAMM|nr:NAD-dependent succinate-semialdehyde dehydrogenase [Entomomonas asaccharolytica]QQP86655.1 NAD-dependent succinate-semialdehyde dehydrogenase [Entomomonas asaccharolytica]
MSIAVQLFINGKWCDAKSGKKIDIVNPATEGVIGQLAHAEQADLDLALKAAEKGLQVWSETSAFERYKLMRKAANLLRERATEIAAKMTEEQGKPIAQAKGEVLSGADVIDWFAEEGRRAYGQIIPAREEGVCQLQIKEPVGVVAAFTPWNFPINQVVRKLSAALAAGCSIIVKAPEETPISPAELIKAFADAGIPDGVVNLVYGVPADISNYLIPHPLVRKISFTGSTAVGKQLAAMAGQHMKLATMELGGHAPVIVCEDADLEIAVKQMCISKYMNAGQVCISPTRFLIHSSIYEKFVEGFIEQAHKIKVGKGSEQETKMGPLANERRIPALERLIKDATDKGAKLLLGGKRIAGKGYFFEPTVLGNVPLQADIMSEEPFGPIALMCSFDTIDEAIKEANRLPYGLAAYAYTQSLATATLLGKKVQSGMLTINHTGLDYPEVHFGGIKDSGYGTEGGSEAINCYLQTKLVTQKAF